MKHFIVSLVSSNRKDNAISEISVPEGTTFGSSKYAGGTNLKLSVIGEGENQRLCFVIDPNVTIGTSEKGNDMVATSGGFAVVGLPGGKQLRVNLNIIG